MTLVKPDLDFVNGIIANGGASVKKCFQCATCSVVCNLSPEDDPYPRKEMIWAQWGLKDKLMGDPDVWLCHWCNDCSTNCPRGAKPGDVMAAIRSMIISTYSKPAILGKMLNDPKYLPVVLGIPAVLLGLLMMIFGEPATNNHMFGQVMPHIVLEPFFMLATGLAAFSAITGVLGFWKLLNANAGPAKISLIEAVIKFAKGLVTHEWFGECEAAQKRTIAHLSIFYGFILLLIATTGAVVFVWGELAYTKLGIEAFGIFEGVYPLTFWHPVKVLGNLGAVALAFGCTWIFLYRMGDQEKVGGGNFADWMFLFVIAAVCVTGVATEAVRFLELYSLAAPVYFVHLVFVFYLLVYAPFSKFAHFIYRSVAMVHAGMRGRWKKSAIAVQCSVSPEAPAEEAEGSAK